MLLKRHDKRLYGVSVSIYYTPFHLSMLKGNLSFLCLIISQISLSFLISFTLPSLLATLTCGRTGLL